MSETLITTVYDPALWAEAVAWQQECGVFDVLSDQPTDAFAAREIEKAAAPEAIRAEPVARATAAQTAQARGPTSAAGVRAVIAGRSAC